MHAFLILGEDPEEVEKKLSDLVEKNGTTPLEFSIDKIEKTRELSAFLKLSQPPKTTIIIKDIDKATIDSLNAFLKNLEEPNENVTFLLTARNEFKVIPTILSRCQIIRTKKEVSQKDQKNSQQASVFLSSKIGKQFQIIDKIKKREEAVLFLQDILDLLQQKMADNSTNLKQTAEFSDISQQALDAINQNGNVTMQLTNMVVKMQKTTGGKDPEKV